MLIIRILWFALGLTWLMAEINLARRSRNNAAAVAREIKTETNIWRVFGAGIAVAFVFKKLQWLPFPIAYIPRQALAFVLVCAGLALRYTAIKTLGGLFTTQVQIQNNHRLISTGPYRLIRHPAYSGILLAFTGIGIAFGDLLALLALTLPSLLAINSRVRLEEQWLGTIFDNSYRDYCQKTRKLIPWLY
jgi:protein-S-isoprenylcysteine O-methyltransferase